MESFGFCCASYPSLSCCRSLLKGADFRLEEAASSPQAPDSVLREALVLGGALVRMVKSSGRTGMGTSDALHVPADHMQARVTAACGCLLLHLPKCTPKIICHKLMVASML